jgi:RNA polymerase sigma-70 factor (ECF subfamily)
MQQAVEFGGDETRQGHAVVLDALEEGRQVLGDGNVIVDHARARPTANGEPADATAAPDDDDEHAAAQDLAGALAFFVAALPSPYREAITLTELEGRTQREAAEMVGVSLSGMKSRVQRGRARLRAMLEACCEIALDVRGRVIACAPRADAEVPEGCCCPSNEDPC